MAIYTNFNQINEYMKIGSAKDSCYICAKKLGANYKRDAYDTMRALEGKVENKKVVTIKKSGIDACICMDCIKEIYDEHIAPTLPKEEVTAPTETNEAVETKVDTVDTKVEVKDTKKKK